MQKQKNENQPLNKTNQTIKKTPTNNLFSNRIGGGQIVPGKMNKRGKVKVVERLSVVSFLVIASNISGQLYNDWDLLDDEEKKNNMGLLHNVLIKELFAITNVSEAEGVTNRDYPYVLLTKDHEKGEFVQGKRPGSKADEGEKPALKEDDKKEDEIETN